MVVNVLMTGDDVSNKLKDYCSGLPDVETKLLEASSDEAKALGATAPTVVVLDEDGKEILATADMNELEKFFS